MLGKRSTAVFNIEVTRLCLRHFRCYYLKADAASKAGETTIETCE